MPVTNEQLLTFIASMKAQLDALAVAVAGQVTPPAEQPSSLPVAQAGNILTLKSSKGKENVTTGTAKVAVGMMVRFANGRSTPVMATDDGITFITREPAADSDAALKKLAGSNLTVESVPGQETPKPVEEPKTDPVEQPTPTPIPTPSGKGALCLNIGQAGGGDTVLPGKAGTNYFWASEDQIKRWAKRGVKRTRVGIAWERIQRALFADLDLDYLTALINQLDLHRASGMQVLVDVHNYAGYTTTNTSANRQQIGTPSVPFGALADLHGKLANALSSHTAFYGLDLCNEPWQMPSGVDGWVKEAQLCINSIRAVDKKCAIAINAYSWATTARFKSAGNEKLFTLVDPSNNLEIHTHLYMDIEGGGKYLNDDIDPMAGVNAMRDPLALCKQKGIKYCLGEVGAPGWMPKSMAALRNTLVFSRDNGVDCYMWWATETAKDNIMSLEADRNAPIVALIGEVFGK